jgi:ArsR family transcriptional regulator
MDPIYEIQAEAIKTLANPRRLEIIHILANGPCEVGRLATEIGVSQPNVSQHLAVMKSAGIVEAERFGREIHYRLADPDVVAACDLMRGVLRRRLARLAGLSDAVAATTPTTTQSTTTTTATEPSLATISR